MISFLYPIFRLKAAQVITGTRVHNLTSSYQNYPVMLRGCFRVSSERQMETDPVNA